MRVQAPQSHPQGVRLNMFAKGAEAAGRRPAKPFRAAVTERVPSTYLSTSLDFSNTKRKLQPKILDLPSHKPDIKLAVPVHIVSEAAARDATATASTSGLPHVNGAPQPAVQAEVHRTAAAPQSESPSSTDPVAITSQVLGDKDLHNELKACDAWQDVLDIVADEVPGLSLRSSVQALTRLNNFAKRMQRDQQQAITNHPAFKALAAQLQTQIPTMNPIQLSNSLYAFAQLKVALPDSAVLLYAARARETTLQFYPRDIATILYAFAVMHARPGRQALDALCFRAQSLLDKGEFEPQSISMLLHSCVVLGYTNNMLSKCAAEQATLHMLRFSPQSVANTTWALARMGWFHQPLIESALAKFVSAPRDFKPQETCNLLWALTHHRYNPEAAFTAVVNNLLAQADYLRPADFATLMHSLAVFDLNPGQVYLPIILKRMQPQIARFNATELCNVYWALGLLGQTEQPAFLQIEALLPQRYDANEMDDGLLRQVFQGFLCAKLAGSTRSPSFSPLMLDAMKRSWISATHPAEQSGGLKEVVDIFSQLKVRHDARRPTKDGLVSIDIALKPSPERFVALQVVYEVDVAVNTQQFLGPLQFQRQVLEKNGWEVMHLSLKDLRKVDPKLRPMFVADLLKRKGIKVAVPVLAPAAGTSATAAAAGKKTNKNADVIASRRELADIVKSEGGGGRRRPLGNERQGGVLPAGGSRRVGRRTEQQR